MEGEFYRLRLVPELEEYLRNSLQTPQSKERFEVRFQSLLRYHGSPPGYTTLRVNTLTHTRAQAHNQLTLTLNKEYEDKGWEAPEILDHPDLPDVLIIPSIQDPTITDCRCEVIVDLACGAAVLRGADVFVQGILAASTAMCEGSRVAVYADVERGCRKGLTKPYTGTKVYVGSGTACFSRTQVFSGDNKLSGVGVCMRWPVYRAPSLSGLLPGLVHAQNLPSIVAGHVLGPGSGHTVLDMCAAPGGKTSHIACLMENKGRVVAFDKSRTKIPRIMSTCEQLGVTIVEAYHWDGTKALDNNADVCGPPPYPAESFDRILVDAPCSALGQRPSLHNPMTLATVKSYPPLQRKLLNTAVSLLKPGGVLVYSTCSLPVEENEAMVAWILTHHSNISLEPQVPHVGGAGLPHPGLSAQQSSLLQRFIWPGIHSDNVSSDNVSSDNVSSDNVSSDTHSKLTVNSDSIGFFIAKFVKS